MKFKFQHEIYECFIHTTFIKSEDHLIESFPMVLCMHKA